MTRLLSLWLQSFGLSFASCLRRVALGDGPNNGGGDLGDGCNNVAKLDCCVFSLNALAFVFCWFSLLEPDKLSSTLFVSGFDINYVCCMELTQTGKDEEIVGLHGT